MSLLPQTLLNSTSNEDQTLEIHSEILEPLSHSQKITRWEIPHKNVLDSDSQLIYKVYWNNQSVNGSGTDHLNGATMVAKPYLDSGLYNLINRARLYVNGVIISELNEVGKYLTLKKNFIPHEVKTEKMDFFSYADHDLEVTAAGQIRDKVASVKRVPGDKELGAKANGFEVEASIRLGDLFGILEGAQLDTNSILGKIMIEIDWYLPANNQNASYVGTAVQAQDKGLEIADPRLILDFLTFNDEVTGALRDTIFGDGPGVNMPFKEVALIRKVTNSGANADAKSEDHFIGMTGRAVQKVWIQKVMNSTNENKLLGPNRSDLLQGQRWNLKVNDLMVFDRDVQNRAEEFNYLEQAGEKQFTCAPATYELRDNSAKPGYVANNDYYVADEPAFQQNTSNNNRPTGDIGPYDDGRYLAGADQNYGDVARDRMGRQNYLAINLAKYGSRESALNAVRVGSTPMIYNLQYNGADDADTSALSGTLFFFVEYLKIMNLKNGEINVMDL
jgi:hypothetical protein